MFRYKLRTLLIVLALGPPAIAWGYWKAEQYHRRQEIKKLVLGLQNYHGEIVLRQPPPAVWEQQTRIGDQKPE